jgi:adenosine deaminase
VTGFGMAGEERFGDPKDFARAFDIAREAGLGITVHAGELAGWESVAAALDHIRPSRIGHGVRAIENPDLVRRIADEGVVLEICPVSNIELKVFPSFRGAPVPEDCAGFGLQGDAQFRRPALFLDLAEARI